MDNFIPILLASLFSIATYFLGYYFGYHNGSRDTEINIRNDYLSDDIH